MKKSFLIPLILLLFCAGVLYPEVISRIEYYFDADPGPGNGNQIYPGRDAVDIDELISTATLEPGIHRLFVRAKEDLDTWGLPRSASFFVPYAAAAFSERSVAAIEYYFDADPGPGSGVPVYGRSMVDLDTAISTSELEPGIHRLYVRAKDNMDIWGLPQSATFFVPFAATAFSERSVAAVEYYFDNDPGPGSGTPIYGSRDAVNLDELINSAPLEPGIHRLYVRAKDDLDIWGLPQSRSFLIPWEAEAGTMITRLEYFVDADPGFGNGTQVELTPGASVSVDLAALVVPVEHGNHCLYIRARNSEGDWGLPACRQFSDGIPANLVISVTDGILSLSWEDLYGIDTYKVFSATLPSGVFSEDTGGIFGTSDWTAPAPDPKRFYQVRSVYGE
ncbi:MAG: hypothetical protein LHW57_05385 [Candidatus Cloacimonetes bacterium]|nr:hypothetical protein [Candidatus Cloacimonadota bacterium]